MALIKSLISSFRNIFKIKKKKSVRPKRKTVRKRTAKKRTVKKKRARKPVRKSIRRPKIVKAKIKKPVKGKPKGVKPAKALPTPVVAKPSGILIGEVTHYFSRIQVIVLKVTNGQLGAGQHIHIIGKSTDFKQKVDSLQIESVNVGTVRKGQVAGLKVKKEAKPGDQVYRI